MATSLLEKVLSLQDKFQSLQERAKLLISIAHPDDREMLDREAFGRFGPHYHNFSI